MNGWLRRSSNGAFVATRVATYRTNGGTTAKSGLDRHNRFGARDIGDRQVRGRIREKSGRAMSALFRLARREGAAADRESHGFRRAGPAPYSPGEIPAAGFD
jgi:hypothetical protein